MARADHVTVSRLGGLFVHHGIDCGDGTVIHFTGRTWSDPRRVRRTALQDFARDGTVTVRDYTDFFERLRQPENLPRRMRIFWQRELMRLAGKDGESKAFTPNAVIGRAESRLGESGFDLVLNNCEHFATWCKTGISDSEQIQALWRAALDRASYRQWRRQSVVSALLDRDASGPSGR